MKRVNGLDLRVGVIDGAFADAHPVGGTGDFVAEVRFGHIHPDQAVLIADTVQPVFVYGSQREFFEYISCLHLRGGSDVDILIDFEGSKTGGRRLRRR